MYHNFHLLSFHLMLPNPIFLLFLLLFSSFICFSLSSTSSSPTYSSVFTSLSSPSSFFSSFVYPSSWIYQSVNWMILHRTRAASIPTGRCGQLTSVLCWRRRPSRPATLKYLSSLTRRGEVHSLFLYHYWVFSTFISLFLNGPCVKYQDTHCYICT